MTVKDRPLVVFVTVNICAIRKVAADVCIIFWRYRQHLYKLAFRADNFIANLQTAVILPSVARQDWRIIAQKLAHASRKANPQEVNPLVKQIL